MRMGLFLDGLAKVALTDVLVLPFGGLPPASRLIDAPNIGRIETISLAGREDTEFKLLSRIKDPAARLAAFRRYGRSSLAASVSAAVLRDISAAIGGTAYDLVHAGRCYLAEAAFAVPQAGCRTLDADENDAAFYRAKAAAASASGAAEKAAFDLAEADAHDHQNARLLRRFDCVFASSTREAGSIAPYCGGGDVIVAPNTVAAPGGVLRQDDANTLLFVGSLNYWPNIDGLAWFVGQVWPRLLELAPKTPNFMIVGRNCPPQVRKFHGVRGISIHEDVASLEPFYAKSTLAIVPLRVGGGTRIKVIEAAMHGVAAVATRLGAEGLPFEDGTSIWLADEPAEMAAAIAAALQSPAKAREYGQKARAVAREKLDYGKISMQLACQWEKLLAKAIPAH